MFAKLRALYQRHTGFIALLVLFVAFRLLAIILFRPGGFIADASDYDFYYEWGLQLPRGYRTFVDLWTAYPPLFPSFMLPIFAWASRIPPWVDPRLFFHLLFGLELLVFESLNFVLIYRLALKLGHPPLGAPGAEPATQSIPFAVLHPAILYALLFVPVYTMLGWFEAMPLFFMLLGLDLLLSGGRWGWVGSALAAALGFLTKLTPAILVPIAIRWLGTKLSWRAARTEWFKRHAAGNLWWPTLYTLLFLGVVIGLGYWLAQGNVDLALSSFRINNLRPPWQSVWALLDGYYGYGLVPLDMRNLVGLERNLWTSSLPWGLITLLFVLLYLWLYTQRYDWSLPRTPIAFAAISIIWLFLYSKGWSPQFLVWILAFLVLLMPTLHGILLGTTLSLINIAESHLFLVMLPSVTWLMTATVLLRTGLLILLAVELLGQIWPSVIIGRLVQRLAHGATWSIMGLTVIGAVVALPPLADAYQARRLAEHPCQAAIVYLQEQAVWPNRTIVSDQIEVWQTFAPWLQDTFTIRVIDGYDPHDRPWENMVAERLAAYVGEQEFWWLTYVDKPSHAAQYFAQPEVKMIEEQQWGACRLARVQRPAAQPLARFDVAGGPIVLRSVAVERAKVGEAVAVVLYWESEAPVAESYTVFTHLVDAAGQLVAQQDNLPVTGLAPTNTWQPGTLIRDPYRLTSSVTVDPTVDPTVVPGDYHVLVGLYNTAGRRTVTLADGSTADQISIPVRLPE